MSYKVIFSLPNNTKILAPFLSAANQLKGPQKSETQEGLLPLFGVCLARKAVFCKESNVSLIACWLLPFLQDFSSTEVLDIILMKLRIPSPSPSYTLDSSRLVSRKRCSRDEMQSSCATLAGENAKMPPKSESLPQPNWKCINIPAQEGHAAVETIHNM